MTFLILLLLTNLVMFNCGRWEISRISLLFFHGLAYRLHQNYDEDEYDLPLLKEDFADQNDCFPLCLVQSPLPLIQQPSRRDTYFLRFGRKR